MFCLPVPTLIYLWEIYIFPFPGSACVYSAAANYVDQSWEYINCSQTHECGNWDWGRAIARKGIHKWDFPCSVLYCSHSSCVWGRQLSRYFLFSKSLSFNSYNSAMNRSAQLPVYPALESLPLARGVYPARPRPPRVGYVPAAGVRTRAGTSTVLNGMSIAN